MLIGFALETNPSDLSGSVGFTDTKKSFTVRMKPDGGSKTDIKSHMMILQFFFHLILSTQIFLIALHLINWYYFCIFIYCIYMLCFKNSNTDYSLSVWLLSLPESPTQTRELALKS